MEEVSAGVPLRGVRLPSRLLRLASDERLVALLRSGDERAFEVLYDRHHRPILGFARHMLGTREEAEDAVQQTFLAAYRDLVGSTKPIQLRPWLFAIARNRCLSMLRARREQIPLELAEPSIEGLAATVERREDVRELLGDLARLPERQRAALLLAELGALDHEGIAAVLDCRREQVKALVFQARTSLAADRKARATPCEDVRAELATATGATLRRGSLRRHLRLCPGCRAFKAEVAHQRQLLAIALPVIPTALLKAGALPAGLLGGTGGTATAAGAAASAAAGVAATAGTGAGGGVAGGGLLALGTTTVAKVALAVAIAGTVAGGGALTLGVTGNAGSASHAPAATTTPASDRSLSLFGPTLAPAVSGLRQPHAVAGSPRSSRARGFAPQPASGAGGNGAAARAFARTRGRGSAIGLGNGAGGVPASHHASPQALAHGRQPAAGSPPGSGRALGRRGDATSQARDHAPAADTTSHRAPPDDVPAHDAPAAEPKQAHASTGATPHDAQHGD